MKQSPVWDRVFSTTSWMLVAFLLLACVSVLTYNPPTGAGPVVSLIGEVAAQYFYGALYGLLAILLGYAKLFKKKTMRKHVLVAVYIVGAFTSILTVVSVGFIPNVIDNIAVTVIAAGCWLYWKFKTEYIPNDIFQKDIEELKRTAPNYKE